MNQAEILASSSMPLMSPSYPKGPYRFKNREYLLIHYESDPDALRQALPWPLELDGNEAVFEFMKMPDSAAGFGDYTEAGVAIKALFNGEPVTYTAQMYLDDEAPITAGREIWGFPKKFGRPILKVNHETLTGTLDYDDERVAMATMVYKQTTLDNETVAKGMGRRMVNLKKIPSVTGENAIVQLVGYHLEDVVVKGAWKGDARLHLVPHIGCRVADLPVKKILYGQHILSDLTLPYGEVLHDYLA